MTEEEKLRRWNRGREGEREVCVVCVWGGGRESESERET